MSKSVSNSKSQPLSAESVAEAEQHLCRVDQTIGRLISLHSPCSLAERPRSQFQTLAWSVIGQQLSAKAAATITGRVAKLVTPPFEAANLLRVSPIDLRSAGLSSRKATCITALAERISAGQLSLISLRSKTDDQVIQELTETSGIGRWTAEMFLIFGMGRPDVLSLGDAGLRRAKDSLYGDVITLESLGAIWSPWCSVASWYLWKHLDS